MGGSGRRRSDRVEHEFMRDRLALLNREKDFVLREEDRVAMRFHRTCSGSANLGPDFALSATLPARFLSRNDPTNWDDP